jgi:hypothetical protein
VNQWEIYDYPFAEEGGHPVPIISNPARTHNEQFMELNGLFLPFRAAHIRAEAVPFHGRRGGRAG